MKRTCHLLCPCKKIHKLLVIIMSVNVLFRYKYNSGIDNSHYQNPGYHRSFLYVRNLSFRRYEDIYASRVSTGKYMS